MYVREVGLNSTMFVSWDGKQICYPNMCSAKRLCTTSVGPPICPRRSVSPLPFLPFPPLDTLSFVKSSAHVPPSVSLTIIFFLITHWVGAYPIVLHVDIYTPQAKILELRARMREYLSKETKEFSPDMEIQIQEIDVKLKLSMVIGHKGNWQESGRRWARRTKVKMMGRGEYKPPLSKMAQWSCHVG